ncbi:two-component regulator propeller domain-containing protein [Haliea sp. E1-2-M8]|uniref:two-component regulator propeller domain-containing protein n=1 Tax=Haliea sp. E1-2-M8 TaxID=3064706 RepID=UPI00272636F2|nr:two-component regulator propeller domain-containing protein [Haliea sp. E1-2-M8]MDO8862574.1 two-component regulator propeller domain-containing protein [Haliea sp. E1-2-M8]
MKLIARFALTLSIVLLSEKSLALSPKDYTFQLSPATRELTQQSVRTIYQDSRGFIWLLTQEGLHKYDGYTVTRFRASNRDPNSISHESTTGIAEDSEGYIWISTAGGGLNKYDPTNHTFKAIKAGELPSHRHPLSNEIYTLFLDSQGDLWLGYDIGTGFSRFSPATQTFEHFPPDQNSVATRAVSFSESSDGVIWALIDGLGLLRINQNEESIETIRVPSATDSSRPLTRLSHIMTASDGSVWISSLDSGIVRFSTKTEKFEYFDTSSPEGKSVSDQTVYMTMEDRSNNIWVATRSGVSVWEPASQTFTWLNSSNSNIPDNQILSVFQSRSGIIWVGTYNGLAYGTRSLFKRVDSILGPPNDSINAFAQDNDEIVWVGSNTGLYTYDPHNTTEDHYFPQNALNDRISSLQVMSLLIEDSILWVGTLNSGLNRVDLETGDTKVYRRRISDPTSISANGITSITRTKTGLMLIGTYGGGLNIYDETADSFSHFRWDPNDKESISSNNVVAITEDSNGEVWIGTENGLNFFDHVNGTFRRFISETSNPESLSSNLAWAIHEDIRGNLWIGTQSGGVNKWSNSDKKNKINRFSQYQENIDLPSADVYGITSDSNSDIWLSHNRGLSRISRKNGTAEHFDLTDGLQGSEFNHGAVLRDKQSRLFFGGNNGFNVIEPENIERNVYLPPVQITEYRLLNEEVFFDVPYDQVQEISLPYNFRYASFTFASLDYTNPSSNQYRYMLERFDDSWIELGNSRSVSFTSLPAGSYVFKLQGSNSDGIWSDNGVAFELNVTPAPWLSKQAYFAYAIFALSIVYLITMNQRAKSQQAIKRQRELELKVQERTVDLEEARNLAERANRSKSDFLATVTHEIRTPMHGMIGMTELLLHTKLSDQQQKFANAAHASGQALLQLINSILDFSKIEAERVEVENIDFDLIQLLDDVCYLQSEPASRKSLDFLYVIEGPLPGKVISDPTKLRQIVINLTSNAIKFTEKGFIRVTVDWQNDAVNCNSGSISITVEDTGIGMDEAAREGMFEAFTQADASTTRKYGGTGLGLAISKRFVDLLSGEILVDSEVHVGTKIKINVPVRVSTNARTCADWGNHNIVVLAAQDTTTEAITSQLKVAGIGFSTTTDWREAMNCAQPYTAILIDSDYFDSINETNSFIRSCPTQKIILLCPLRKDTSGLDRSILHVITKPLTSSVLLQHLQELFDIDHIRSGNKVQTQHPMRDIKPSVLVAEDLETNQKIIGEILQMYGCNITISGNGLEALELAKRQQFDIIFMDCQMPIMDGYQATANIREYEKTENRSKTPIIALTAGNTSEEKQRGLSAGMNRYLTKPFKIGDIREVLETYSLFKPAAETSLGPSYSSVSASSQTTTKDFAKSEIFNLNSIENIKAVERQTGNPILLKLLIGFEEQMNGKIVELAEAEMTRDAELASTVAHAIKSMSANLGAEKVRLISAEVEKKSRRGDLTDLDSKIEDIELAYKEFLQHAEELTQTT